MSGFGVHEGPDRILGIEPASVEFPDRPRAQRSKIGVSTALDDGPAERPHQGVAHRIDARPAFPFFRQGAQFRAGGFLGDGFGSQGFQQQLLPPPEKDRPVVQFDGEKVGGFDVARVGSHQLSEIVA